MPKVGFDLTFVVLGGGSGPGAIEDGLLNITEKVYGVTGIHDRGGHSKEIRTVVGTVAPGDMTHRFAIHLRDPRMRQLMMHRWQLNCQNNINGHRPSNELFAAAMVQEGSASKAAKLIEQLFNPHYYKGRVLPITDDNVDIAAICEDGSIISYEDQIGERKTNKPAIVDVKYFPHRPKANPEVVKIIGGVDCIILSCTSLYTSLLPLLKITEINKAIKKSPAKVFWVCNAFTNFSETDGYKASDHAKVLYSVIGRKIDLGLLNIPNHPIPPGYTLERSSVVEPDSDSCQAYVKKVITGSFTKVFDIDHKPTVRHDGKLVASLIVSKLRK